MYVTLFEKETPFQEIKNATDSLNLWFEVHKAPYQFTLFETCYHSQPPQSILLTYEVVESLSFYSGEMELETYALNRMDHINQSELLLGHVSSGTSKAKVLNYKISDVS